MLPDTDGQDAERPNIFIAALGDKAQGLAFSLCNTLRLAGIRADMDFSNKSLKSQMKRSNKLSCSHTLIIGEKEMEEGKAQLRNMGDGTQEFVDINDPGSLIRGVRGR